MSFATRTSAEELLAAADLSIAKLVLVLECAVGTCRRVQTPMHSTSKVENVTDMLQR
eukprot:COSAG05_NODE_3057_length_2374_cov_1.756923_1_plen_57_part_00